eukprot:GHUV01043290.1.p1 GENE.GHUV01043290.1~~GHUV01043290.1.p1  ORF type:complete len:149 (+),score=34.72 GHUV01043290.1:1-447(+)
MAVWYGLLLLLSEGCSCCCCCCCCCPDRSRSMDPAVLNAGIGEHGDFLDSDMTTEALEKTLDVDLRAVITGVRYASQAMITAGIGGRLSSIASSAGAATMDNRHDAQAVITAGNGGRIISIASAAGITAVSQQQRQLCPMMPALRGWA